ncbi:hypothetical protein IFM89_037588 [Coptis chinensis]|uniref:EF-hand domain-containing protein n=1 Tax=Coptis chinensis TaxID=261450 RepID=A0A835HAZ0_9MAGN|nr:hypothetical protein IFM89_037588 [Coptis chinensis]
MKLITQLNPKHLFRSKKSRSVSRSEPPSFSSGSSSSSDGSSSNLKCSTTPKSVLSSHLRSKSHEIQWSNEFSSEIQLDHVQAFKLIDKDNDGKITRTELVSLLTRLGAEPLSEDELTLMLTDVDRDGDGCISLEKFGAISSAFEGPAVGTELKDAFDCFDADRDGKISAEELMGVFIAIGDAECTLADCKRMIASVDSDGDGFVCFEDFTRMMMEHHQIC